MQVAAVASRSRVRLPIHFFQSLHAGVRVDLRSADARVAQQFSDNRTGGWYGYRASKAALNMVVKSAAIEISRSRPLALCVALHPGTVDTGLSQPFQRGVPPDRLFSPKRAAQQLLDVLGDLQPRTSGKVFAWDGREIAP